MHSLTEEALQCGSTHHLFTQTVFIQSRVQLGHLVLVELTGL